MRTKGKSPTVNAVANGRLADKHGGLPRRGDLILTASNKAQADAYRAKLEFRGRLGLVGQAGQVVVLADPTAAVSAAVGARFAA